MPVIDLKCNFYLSHGVLCTEPSFLIASYIKESEGHHLMGVDSDSQLLYSALRVTYKIPSSRRGEVLVNICAFVSTFVVDFLDPGKFSVCQLK